MKIKLRRSAIHSMFFAFFFFGSIFISEHAYSCSKNININKIYHAYLSEGSYSEAKNYLEESVSNCPFESNYYLGELILRSQVNGEICDAVTHFEEALKINELINKNKIIKDINKKSILTNLNRIYFGNYYLISSIEGRLDSIDNYIINNISKYRLAKKDEALEKTSLDPDYLHFLSYAVRMNSEVAINMKEELGDISPGIVPNSRTEWPTRVVCEVRK